MLDDRQEEYYEPARNPPRSEHTPIQDPLRLPPPPVKHDYDWYVISTALRMVALVIFALIFLVGFPEWFFTGMDKNWDGHQAAWWDTWVVAMIGIGLTEIVRHLAAIRDKAQPPLPPKP